MSSLPVGASEGGSAASSGATRASLLSRARARDETAWRELVELYGPLVAHWCHRSGLDAHTVADLVQEVFASVARGLESYRPLRVSGAFRSWLWTITANKVRDIVRRHQQQTRASGGSTALRHLQEVVDEAQWLGEAESSDPTSPRALQALVARALAQVRVDFEPRTWEIFQRSVVDQQPTSKVATEYGISQTAVRQIRSRVLRRLRQQLGDLPE